MSEKFKAPFSYDYYNQFKKIKLVYLKNEKDKDCPYLAFIENKITLDRFFIGAYSNPRKREELARLRVVRLLDHPSEQMYNFLYCNKTRF